MNSVQISERLSSTTYNHIDVDIVPEEGIVWLYLNPYPRPCVTPHLISDIRSLQKTLEHYGGRLFYDGKLETIRYHIMDSRTPDVFSMGGDLAHFQHCIKNRDKQAMLEYGKACIDAIHPIMANFNMPIVTISLVRGDALGGGFEIALSGDVIIAERRTQMGFPEILFNLFPGMGAYQLLSQRLSSKDADKMIASGRIYRAEELYDMGIIDILVEDGEGDEAVYSYIHTRDKHWNGYMAMQEAKQKFSPIDYDELIDICCNVWVEAAMRLSSKDLRIIDRLIKAQNRRIRTNRNINSNHGIV